MKTTAIITSLLIAFLSFTKTCIAQWTSNTALNTPVCTEIGKQIDLRMAEDGNQGVFIAWKDYRTSGGFGLPDIYVQHLNKAGVAQWDTNGVALCTNSADQSTPAIVTDMTGGVIVAWSDWRSSVERDIYAQRIDSNGVVQWTIDGVGVANKPQREHNEKIITDDAGGAIIVWEQQSAGQWDIWAQHINHNGVAMWPIGGVPVCTVNANRLNPKVQKDGKGGAYVTWQDFRNATDYNIYVQRLSPGGILMWGAGGVPVCMAADAQTDPKIDPDSLSGGVYIAWVDKRNTLDYDIYAQRIDSLGVAQWVTDGMPVCTAGGNQSAQDILSTGAVNGLIVTWKDYRFGNYDIFAQKLNPAGAPQWMVNGVSICTSIRDQLNPNIITDHSGGAIITWQDSTLQDWNVKSQRINGNGTVQWLVNGLDVCTATGAQTSPKNVSDGHGGSIYAWQDKRTGTADIYAHHLYADGTTTMGIAERTVTNEITISPNPTSGQFTVSSAKYSVQRIKIYTIQGVPVYCEQRTVNNKVDINMSNHAKGVYFIQLTDEDKNVITKKVVLH